MRRAAKRFVLTASMCAVLLVLAVTQAQAQCSSGRVVSEATAGRCCWPDQRWNEAVRACVGPPTCPPEREAHGDDCLAASRPPQPAAGQDAPALPAEPDATLRSRSTATSPPHAPSGWPATFVGLDDALTNPTIAWHSDLGMALGGVAVMGAAYLIQIIGGLADESAGSCRSYSSGRATNCGGWAWSFVPFAGGVITRLVGSGTGGRYSPGAFAFGFGMPIGIAQIVGLVLTIAGATARRPHAVSHAELRHHATLRVAPSASATLVGLTMSVEM